jgi:hypothetical protein
MQETHGLAALTRVEIKYRGDESSPAQKAIWNPGQVWTAASFGCTLCPPGTLIPQSPGVHFGDANRNAIVLSENPQLQTAIFHLPPEEQAEYLEAFDRGLLDETYAAETRRQLERARRAKAARRPSEQRVALTRIMNERTVAGDHISSVIHWLAGLSRDNPEHFTFIIGQGLGIVSMEDDVSKGAQRTEEFLGVSSWPSAAESTLWNYWRNRSEIE